jgi:hypothetical protein
MKNSGKNTTLKTVWQYNIERYRMNEYEKEIIQLKAKLAQLEYDYIKALEMINNRPWPAPQPWTSPYPWTRPWITWSYTSGGTPGTSFSTGDQTKG